jgi:hypothetical protein
MKPLVNALALVESPFHLLCLQEAISHYSVTRVNIIVMSDATSRNHQQILGGVKRLRELPLELEISYGDWNAVKGGSLQQRIEIYANRLKDFSSSDYDFVFFCDFRAQWQKDIVESQDAPNTIMLDDGTATLSFLYYHAQRGICFDMPVYGSPERRKEAAEIKKQAGLTKWKDIIPRLFTIFEQHAVPGFECERNPLSNLYTHFTNLDENTDVIIGAKIVERDICSVDDYHTLIERIIDSCTGQLIYIPHRGQSQAFNDSLANRFPELNVLYTDMPIENWIAQQSCPPARFHGFVSTAFYVIDRCFPQLAAYCYEPPESILSSAETAGVYGSTQFNNRQVFELYYQCLPDSVSRILWDRKL